MTSAQIRATLKPMADFAPAILRCAEIVEAAEAAEARFAQQAEALEAQQRTIVELQTQEAEARAAVTATAGDLATAQAEVAAQKTKLIATLKPLQDKIDQATAALTALTAEQTATMSRYAEEIRMQESLLEDRKRAVLAFKQSLPD